MGQAEQTTSSIADWRPHLSIGVTGHREGNAAFAANRAAVKASIDRLLRTIDELARKHDPDASVTRLHCLLADGVDQIAAECAFALGWDLVAPLPFGADLNIAINAVPLGAEDAARLCEGKPALDPQVEARASSIRAKAKRALLFELADRDAEMRTLFEAMLASPEDPLAAQAFDALCSEKVANAGQVMIERVDFVIAVWDYKDNHHRGGTGHTVSAALAMGTPVLVIDRAGLDQSSPARSVVSLFKARGIGAVYGQFG